MKLGYAIPHEIKIRASANMAFIVKIGCGEFVAENKNILLGSLTEYLKDPEGWEKDYNKLPGGGRPEVEQLTDPEPPVPIPDLTPAERETDGDGCNEVRG